MVRLKPDATYLQAPKATRQRDSTRIRFRVVGVVRGLCRLNGPYPVCSRSSRCMIPKTAVACITLVAAIMAAGYARQRPNALAAVCRRRASAASR